MWFPEHFDAGDQRHSLLHYHRNLTFASMQTERLAQYVCRTAARWTGRSACASTWTECCDGAPPGPRNGRDDGRIHPPGAGVCLEGVSAVGKTTLAAALARQAGAAVIPELDGSGAPPAAESGAWFVDAHAAQWRRARALAADAPLVVMDCDPLKGLWFNWVFAEHGWPGIEVQGPLYRAHVLRGTMAFPDLYVVLQATDAQLRARRAGDPTRTRRNHEMHLRLAAPQRRYFEELQSVDPPRVLLLDTSDRDALVDAVLAAVQALPPGPPDSMRLLDRMVDWVAARTRFEAAAESG